jgi:hypothetical protein
MTNALVALACLAVAVGEGPQAIRPNETTTLSGVSGKRKVTVVIQAKEWPTNDLLDDERATWAHGNTVLVVRAMKITIGDHALWVARSSFADLLQVRTVELQVARGGGSVIIRGGDASTSFEARIEFDDKGVTRRRILGEERLVTEETVYLRHVIP